MFRSWQGLIVYIYLKLHYLEIFKPISKYRVAYILGEIQSFLAYAHIPHASYVQSEDMMGNEKL